MYYNDTPENLRAYCRNCLESMEIWARRLINDRMSNIYGVNFIYYKDKDGKYLVKKEIREHVKEMRSKEGSRFSRDIDTLFLDQIIYFLCNHNWYASLFSNALKCSYPLGHDEAREYLKKLIPIRNALSHSNPISIRQAEQAICYSHDFIDGIKEYYKLQGKEQMWNVPRIIKITDSFGNEFENPVDSRHGGSNFLIKQIIRPGDTYSVHIETDPSFGRDSYTIKWTARHLPIQTNDSNDHISVVFDERAVGEMFLINCRVISKKTWHKYGTFDCEIALMLNVYPPLESL